ncbi:DUF2244 domain-containing protein [Histidinibacterium aquaticum]|uniref:DUF2244 domain-containing protein n=1 Tax=Histidinibacterium aquaticum TaxID=2613962 RepID=A0A5J5GPM8_9RHOB|nr:DUF2244 domain-containing protein [Histidinibacterium aquaticum]KAA9010120.1 DUF2244 domain-containing protein [Histidinibacterium aquaticum]
MPYEWTEPRPGGPGNAPLEECHLWPFRSLPRRGMVVFIGITCALVSIPLLAVVGSPVLWGLLPFLIIAIGGVWWAIERSYRDGTVLEVLRLWPDRVALTRHNPRGPRQEWEANPYWVDVRLHADGGPVEDYLTLKGNGREVELGAFLAPEERKALHDDLTGRIARLRAP